MKKISLNNWHKKIAEEIILGDPEYLGEEGLIRAYEEIDPADYDLEVIDYPNTYTGQVNIRNVLKNSLIDKKMGLFKAWAYENKFTQAEALAALVDYAYDKGFLKLEKKKEQNETKIKKGKM